ncbi:MAG: hypothetical protein J0L75_17880 [Spirochaetes bacterium]|nr:hypothetical protein [Spirochaetota bacterium]
MNFFDADFLVGDGPKPSRFPTGTVGEVLAQMDHFGIQRSLFRSAAHAWSIPDGNRLAASFAPGEARLVPAWFLVPHHAGEFPSPEELPGAMKRAGVGALVCDPALPFSTRRTFCGDLFAVCEERRIPILMPAPDYPGYEKCDQVLCEFPKLTLVALNGHSWGLARYTWPLLERFPSFHLALGPCRVSGEVQETVKRFGARRLCFSTGAPR